MFGLTMASRRLHKINYFISKMEQAEKDGKEWKKRLYEGKMAYYKSRYSRLLWDSASGSYRKR